MKKKTEIILLFVAAILFISGCSSISDDWAFATTQDNLKAYEVFLQKHPDSQYTTEAKTRIEEFDWKQAQASKTISSFWEFLRKHPDSQYMTEAKTRIEELDWKQAQASSTIVSFRVFLMKHPDSQYAIEANEFLEKAKQRVNWLKTNRAVVEIDYPAWVSAGPSPYSNISGPIYKWNTIFRETGGKAGFTLQATNFYIRDPSGGIWSHSFWSDHVSVKPNGSAETSYWCDKSNKWAGGDFHTTWFGEDDWGNQISIEQVVHLEDN